MWGLVLGGLRRMQAQSEEAAKAITNCWEYLAEHRKRTAYRIYGPTLDCKDNFV